MSGRRGSRAGLHAHGLMLVLSILALYAHSASSQQTDVLLSLQSELGGTTAASWSGDDPCGIQSNIPWQGIQCDTQSSPPVITSLNLVASNASGTIPTSLFTLQNLITLNLGGNPGISGSIPDMFGNLPSLQYLDMHSCDLTGSFPASIAKLSNLTFLALSNNTLNGNLPSDLGTPGSLSWLDINSNEISGAVPESLTACTALSFLHLSYNSLSSLPTSLTVLQNLVQLLLDNNNFAQPFPSGFSNSTSLRTLRIGNNKWTVDSLPNILPASLQELFASNAFDVPMLLPDLAAVAPNLEVIQLANNSLFGTIPTSFTTFLGLYSLSLASNNLNGSIPIFNSSGQPKLGALDFQNNHLDKVPLSTISQPGILFQPLLAGNPFCTISHSTIDACQPQTSVTPWNNDTNPFCQFRSCRIPDQGVIKPNPAVFFTNGQCVCASPLVAYMQLNSPAFSFFNDDLSSNLQSQIFQHLRQLPVPVSGLERLEQINISQVNQQSMNAIPFWVTIWFFNMSEANPLDINSTKAALMANRTFLTQPFGLQNTASFQDPVPVNLPSAPSPSSYQLSGGAIAGIVVGSVVGVVGLIALITLLLIRRQQHQARQDDLLMNQVHFEGITRFRLQEIKRATNDFTTLLGEGGYGQVYRGTLGEGGREVAVKRAKPGVKQGAETFCTELELLSKVRHKNLVALLGFCKESDEQLLVFEFIPNGTLDSWITHETTSQRLSWMQRLRIAEGAATGLSYLHNSVDPQIVHRDIKPANILLTEDMEAKVADFGLSRIIPQEELLLGANTLVKGTIGYLDPEYAQLGQLSDKSDVYSLGVVLLQLATGKRTTVGTEHIRAWVVETVRNGGIQYVMDDALAALPDSERPLDIHFEAFLRLAMRCCNVSTDYRPTMDYVKTVLSSLYQAGAGNSGSVWSSSAPEDNSSNYSRPGGPYGSTRLPRPTQFNGSGAYASGSSYGSRVQDSQTVEPPLSGTSVQPMRPRGRESSRPNTTTESSQGFYDEDEDLMSRVVAK